MSGCGWIEAVAGRAIFQGSTPDTGWEPWVSDGTAEGTELLADAAPATGSSLLTSAFVPTAYRGTLLFQATTPQHGGEIWQTDGTPLGTSLVRDIFEGPDESVPRNPTIAGDRLFIAANSLFEGRELWSLDDDRGPAVWASFDVLRSPHRVIATFNEDVAATLSADDWQVLNLTTGQLVPAADLQWVYDAGAKTATLTFPNYPSGMLRDGRYRATLPAGSVADDLGNPLASTFAFDFFFLNGDANRDGTVNLQDFNRLAINFGHTNCAFGEGDFNYDGHVNLQDFNILAIQFGKSLTPPGAAAATRAQHLGAVLPTSLGAEWTLGFGTDDDGDDDGDDEQLLA
jgi:ELWxxDGT repeat protein